jgi:CHAD domain-containing protein
MAKAKPIKGLNPHAPTGENARAIAKTRLEDMYEWDRYVDNPYNVRELHDLRIAAKRLRYTLEVFEDVLPETSQLIVEELTQIQDELGTLHDSDVIIALLRLCLGSQDSGTVYEDALSKTTNQNGKQKTLVQPELMADLLNPAHIPSAEERYGLEQLLVQQEQSREKQYTAFRQHWYQLQAHDFHRQILDMLDTPT